MQSVARSSLRSAPRLRRVAQQLQKRQASHGHEPEPQHHTSPPPPNESFGSGFFVGILCIPAAIGLYSITKPDKNGQDPYFTRLIKQEYAKYAEQDAARNTLHTDAVEQAAEDKTLFLNDPGQYNAHIEHRFPELMNSGSPYNVPAGHGFANIDVLIAKYQKEANELQEKKYKQLRENKVPAEQPYVPTFVKPSAGAADS